MDEVHMLTLRQKYLRRIRTLKSKIEKGETPDKSVVWKWLHDMIETLGCDGMSSEESSVEDEINMVYKVKAMPWRRDIDEELKIIDSERIRDPSIFGRQGSRPAKRHRAVQDLVSKCEPVEGLPRAFYDDDWFENKASGEFKSSIHQAPFQWMNIVVEEEG
jgi:hypothetical protein